uniref:Ig-like domain-containing protein n=1 Tax=Anabas testudineus TaxID=64144 RepID=A0A3Q1JB78_ANATE
FRTEISLSLGSHFHLLLAKMKHFLTYFLTTSSGLHTFPEFVSVSVVDGVQVCYCDNDSMRVEPRHDWIKQIFQDHPEHLDWLSRDCRATREFLREAMGRIQLHFNHTGGVHIFQNMFGCDWDDETDMKNGFQQFGYDGEGFVSLDLKNYRWTYTELAATYTHKWDKYNTFLKNQKRFLTNHCRVQLEQYVKYGNSSLQRKDLPSVSLLQKTPSSPVSCHATGFYPDRASMFWRKDGEEIHEDVDHGEILPNHDGTFQMRVDLNISSVKPEDWSRYDCVFQISDVEDDIITKLNKTVIRTNWGKTICFMPKSIRLWFIDHRSSEFRLQNCF